jgi:hypothetical protein
MLFRSITLFVLLTSASAAVYEEPVELGTAGDFAILTKSGITTTGVTSVKGDLGTNPIALTAITGFSLTHRPDNTHSHSAMVDGDIFAASHADPTPAKMTAAIGDIH